MLRYANPARFMQLSAALLPWLSGAAAALIALGLYHGLVAAPPDYQQGDTVRIMFIHVPAAWVAMMAYGVMAAASLIGLVWR
ncbi:MAG TPA: cytochrome c biogenesis protein, partial [Rhizomicrobium sp.]|nr:cytochrome c biogenesis protein [Rhizomicrobium sp.]